MSGTTNFSDTMIRVENRGVIFIIKKDKLCKYPQTLMASLDHSSEYYDVDNDRYIFDQNPLVFHAILDFYNYGELHVPNSVCPQLLQKELEFWRIYPSHLEKCCLDEHMKKIEISQMLNYVWAKLELRLEEASNELDKNSLRYRMWLFLNNPSSSKPATVSYLFIYMYFFYYVFIDLLINLFIN